MLPINFHLCRQNNLLSQRRSLEAVFSNVYLVYQLLLLSSSLSFQNKPSSSISYSSSSTISSRAQSLDMNHSCSSYRLAFGFEQTQQTAVGRYG